MKKFSSVFSCFHTDIMNKYIFPVQRKIFLKFSETYFFGNATSLMHTYVSSFPGEEFKPEFLNLTVWHLLNFWCCVVHSEVGHCRWNCQCDQMHRYTAEVRGDRSIPQGLDPIRSV